MQGLIVRILTVLGVLGLTFAAGVSVGRAQAPSIGWGPAVIHVGALKPDDFPAPVQPGAARVKMVARNDGGAVQVQMGATVKHYHENSNEVQYILEGSGMFWLGDKQVPVGPGDLIIIPKNTAHGMSTPYKAIAFKSPPQAPGDIHPLP